MTHDETRKCLQHLLDTVQHLDAQFKEMSRDGLLELWWRQPYNEPAYQYAIIVALKTYHQLAAPLYPYDLQTDEEQFRFLPSTLLAETETKVREVVERNAAYAFNIMDQYGFVLEPNSFRGKHPLANHSHQTEFDELVEQQDQELAQNGEVSPFTQMQLHALAQGQPIPHVDLNSPAIQAATARLRASVRRYRQSSTNPSVPVEDDLWSGDGYDLE